MDKTFNISVRDRLAKNLSHLDYVCGNTGYIVQFDFDEEWDAYPIKTAHFIESSGEHHNATVIDNQCEFPQIMNTIRVEVGVYAGDLHVTTPAVIGARRSILSTGGDRPAVPEENEYDKMMEAINQDAVRAEEAANKAEEKLADMQERYYTPSVNEDGDLSWKANDKGMPDVPTVNIKGVPGKPGDDGYSPSVNIIPIDNGHRVTFTDANGAKTFDVMNGKPGEDAENDELFVVRRVNTYSADKTYEEIETAIAQRRAVMLVDGGTVFHYIRTDSEGIVFSRYYESTNNKYPGIWESRATINKNNVLSVKTFSPAKTPNPRKLILTGAVSAEYDGSEAVTVEIPAGGEGNGTGLPTGGEPHQMLVTDAEGKAKWEPKKQITGEVDANSYITFSMPIADMYALGEELINYDISISYGLLRYAVNSCVVGTSNVWLYCDTFDSTTNSLKKITVYLDQERALIYGGSLEQINLHDIPEPDVQRAGYVLCVGSSGGEYVLSPGLPPPMVQAHTMGGIIMFATGEPMPIADAVELYGDLFVDLRMLVVEADENGNANQMQRYIFDSCYFSEDGAPEYAIFTRHTGKTIRWAADGTLSFVE